LNPNPNRNIKINVILVISVSDPFSSLVIMTNKSNEELSEETPYK
jgi:hypothetical protein